MRTPPIGRARRGVRTCRDRDLEEVDARGVRLNAAAKRNWVCGLNRTCRLAKMQTAAIQPHRLPSVAMWKRPQRSASARLLQTGLHEGNAVCSELAVHAAITRRCIVHAPCGPSRCRSCRRRSCGRRETPSAHNRRQPAATRNAIPLNRAQRRQAAPQARRAKRRHRRRAELHGVATAQHGRRIAALARSATRTRDAGTRGNRRSRAAATDRRAAI